MPFGRRKLLPKSIRFAERALALSLGSRIEAFYDVTRMVELLPKRGLTTLLEVEPKV